MITAIVQYRLPPTIDQAACTGPWLEGIRERYGMDPEIRYFYTAAITDNSTEAVLLPEAAE